MNLETDIDSLTSFKRETARFLERLRETGAPVVLTVNGKAEVVVQDAAAYQRLVDAAARSEREETLAAIRTGLDDAGAGRSKKARTALRTLARRFGLETPEE